MANELQTMIHNVQLDDVVRLRKPHPCGSSDWQVLRLGADIRLKCCRCQHIVMLPRPEFERRVKSIIKTENPTSE